MTSPTSQSARVELSTECARTDVGRLRGGDESEGIPMFFSTEGNTSDTDSAVAEREASEVSAEGGRLSQDKGPSGEAWGAKVDALVAAGRRALRKLDDMGVYGGAAQELRNALVDIIGGNWEAADPHRRVIVTGDWEYARTEVSAIARVPLTDVKMRRLS